MPAEVEQLTPFDYRNPDQLPDGGVLVVGASATGVQLAAELRRSGRPVTLSVGEHVRLPRTYRGRDVLWWMDASGVWDQRYDEVDDLTRARRLPSPQLVGTPERATLDLNALAAMGVELVGRWASVRDGRALFSGGLRNVCSLADLKLERLLDGFDEWAETSGCDARGRRRPSASPRPRRRASPRWQLDLRSGEIRTIVWATGFRPDYRWLDVPVARREGPAPPRRRRRRQPGPVRPGPARAAAAQVHVHLRHRGRRARGDRPARRVPGGAIPDRARWRIAGFVASATNVAESPVGREAGVARRPAGNAEEMELRNPHLKRRMRNAGAAAIGERGRRCGYARAGPDHRRRDDRAVIALAILLADVNANSGNAVVKGSTRAPTSSPARSPGLLRFGGHPKRAITVNWGIAAVVYLLAGALVARRSSCRPRRPSLRQRHRASAANY